MTNFHVLLIFFALWVVLIISVVTAKPINHFTDFECTKVVVATEYNQTATCDQWTRKETK
jgi:hypothetical protein